MKLYVDNWELRAIINALEAKVKETEGQELTDEDAADVEGALNALEKARALDEWQQAKAETCQALQTYEETVHPSDLPF